MHLAQFSSHFTAAGKSCQWFVFDAVGSFSPISKYTTSPDDAVKILLTSPSHPPASLKQSKCVIIRTTLAQSSGSICSSIQRLLSCTRRPKGVKQLQIGRRKLNHGQEAKVPNEGLVTVTTQDQRQQHVSVDWLLRQLGC